MKSFHRIHYILKRIRLVIGPRAAGTAENLPPLGILSIRTASYCFGISCILLNPSCLRKESTLTPAQRCELQPDYVWKNNQCLILGSLTERQLDCNQRKDGSKWVNETCVLLQNQIHSPNETLQLDCEKNPEFSWKINKETGQGSCLKITTETKKERCLAQEKGAFWDEKSSECLSPKQLSCLKGGDTWSQSETRCLTKAEKTCLDRRDGSSWIEGKCLSAGESNCKATGLQVWDHGQKNCRMKNFYDYCSDKTISEELKKTVQALAEFVPYTNNCSQIFEELKRRPLLSLQNKSLKDLAPLHGLEDSLKQLLLQNNQITSLEALEKFHNLTSLNLSQNKIQDLSSLKYLKGLESIDLSENEVSDLAPLAELTKIRDLILRKNKIGSLKDYVSLQGASDGAFIHLKNIDLSDNCDLSELSGLLAHAIYLESLNIHHTKIDPKTLSAIAEKALTVPKEDIRTCD